MKRHSLCVHLDCAHIIVYFYQISFRRLKGLDFFKSQVMKIAVIFSLGFFLGWKPISELAQIANPSSLLSAVLYQGLILGVYFLLFFIALFRYLYKSKERTYAYLAGYSLFSALLIWRNLCNKFPDWDFIAELIPQWHNFRLTFLFVIIICYQGFFLCLLPKKSVPVWLNRYIKISNRLLLIVFIPIQLIFSHIDSVPNFDLMVNIGIAISLFYWLFIPINLNRKNKDPLIRWLYFGTICLITGLISAQLLNFFYEKSDNSFNFQEIPERLGVFLQLISFAAALSLKHRQTYLDKNAAEEEKKATLTQNLHASQKHEAQLSQELKEKKNELRLQTDKSTQQYSALIQANNNREIAEIALQSIREQVKPHFIANATNSIRNMVVQENILDAKRYLQELMQFLSMIHRYTEASFIRLDKELILLKNYLNLELMRFQNRFRVVYELQAGLANQVAIPPLLLQTFAENSIKHAFSVEKHEQILRVQFYRDAASGLLVVALEDNGIGRDAAALKPKMEHSGVGKHIAEERIALFNKLDKGHISIRYIDLFEGKQAVGLRVEIIFSPTEFLSHDQYHHR